MSYKANIKLKQLDLKTEDLTANQIDAAKEINFCIKSVQDQIKLIKEFNHPFGVAECLGEISVIYSRIGTIIADFEYEYTKIVDIVDFDVLSEWKRLSDEENTAAYCNKLSDLVVTQEIRKSKRIAKWLLEKTRYYYRSIEKIINSYNRKHDDLVQEKILSRHQQ